MWHEARKQERKIRVMMVDYVKRADRRRQFYEQIKLDPTQFLRVYGRPVKIHLDPAIATAAEGPQIMQPWQGNQDILIDRYDVRTHIDYIPELPTTSKPTYNASRGEDDDEESRCCYERYRILVQNECAGVTEDQCLNQIYLDEQFGGQDFLNPVAKKAEEDKKKVADKKAAIGYTYTDSTPAAEKEGSDADEDEESSDEEIDLDNILDIDALTEEQEQVLNTISVEYGMKGMDYSECLQLDRDEVEALRQARQLEEEKAQFSGRKSRRERRAFKEKRMKDRRPSPPSYAAKESPTKTSMLKALSSSRSRSRSPPPPAGIVQFITSFGDDSDAEGVVQGPTLPPTQQTSSRSYRSRDSRSPGRRRRSSIDHRSPPSRTSTRSSYSSRRTSQRSRSRSRGSRSRSHRSRSRSRGRANRERSLNDRSRSRAERSRSRDRGSRYGNHRWGRNDETGSSRRGDRERSSRLSQGSPPARSRGNVARNSASRGRRSRSRSGSLSKQRMKTASRSTSTSSSSSRQSSSQSHPRQPSPPPIKSYRRPSLSSRSGSSSDSDDDDSQTVSSTGPANERNTNRSDANRGILGKVEGTASKGSTLTPQERLKRRMQLALNRQYKADKRAQLEKINKEEQQRLDREEELRVIAMQMRQRERERRHREREDEDRHDNGDDRRDDRSRSRRHRSSSRSRSRSSSRSRIAHRDRRRRSRSHSRSSPKPRLVDY